MPCGGKSTTPTRPSCYTRFAGSATAWAPLPRRGGAMFRSLRWRLTALYVALLTGALLLFSAGTYLAARAVLMENFDEVLVDQATLVAQAIDIDDGIPQLKQEVLLSGHRNDDHFTRLYAINGIRVFDDTTDGPQVPDIPT